MRQNLKRQIILGENRLASHVKPVIDAYETLGLMLPAWPCYTSKVPVLAIDTSTAYLVLGLPHAERTLRLGRRHAEALWPELEAFLEETATKPSSLIGVAVGEGPGSYTGLRVGIAAGLGLGRGLGIPVVGVNTLEGVACRYQGAVTVAHATRNGLAYTATYQVLNEAGFATIGSYFLGNANIASQVADRTEIKVLNQPHRAKTDAISPQGIFSFDEPPSGKALARLGAEKIARGLIGVNPLYL